MTDLIAAKLLGGASMASAAGSVFIAVIGEPVLIAVVTSLASVLMAGMSAYFAYKAKTTSAETHAVVNSRMTEFMEMAKKFYKGEGKLEGQAEEKAKQAIREQAVTAATISKDQQSTGATAPQQKERS